MARHSGILKNAADKQKGWHNPEAPPRQNNAQAPWGLDNPEAPFDGLNDHWEPPPQSRWWWVFMVIMVGLIMLGMIAFAFAHMHDRPDLNAWFDGLQSSGGYPCCSQVDGSTVADPDWDTTVIDGTSHYRVRVGGQWIVVTDAEVVLGPNKYGRPLVWVYHNIDGKPMIRCFLPGVQG